MIQPRRFGYATYSTPDVARQAAYYAEVMGLAVVAQDARRAVLSSYVGDEAIVFEHGSEAACTKVSLQVDPAVDLAEAPRLLGLLGEFRSDLTPQVARSFVFRDPNGIEIELFQPTGAGQRSAPTGVAPLRAAHISFGVPDCKLAAEFYTSKLGFRISDWMGDFFVFLRCCPEHHQINFHTHRAMTRPEVHHIAFELRDWAHVQAACEVLGRNGRRIIWGPGRHGIGHGIFVYHRDPDDNIIEVFTEIDQLRDEALGFFEPRPWHEDTPQRPKSWQPDRAALVWGAQPTPDFLRGSSKEMPAAATAAEPTGRDRYLAP